MWWLVFPILAAAALLTLFLVAPGRSAAAARAPFAGRNFAHRGAYSADQSVPENSMPAFSEAIRLGYGFETDIQLSRDGQVVVFHDDTLLRACGVNGRVDAYDYEALKKMSLFGTDVHMPLFSELLALVGGRVPLIVELKRSGNNAALCKKAKELLDGYRGEFCAESFDPRIVRWMRKNAPGYLRGQLAEPYRTAARSISPALAFVLSRLLMNVLARPQFIAFSCGGKKNLLVRICEGMGAMRVCWTARPGMDAAALEHTHDAVIFEHYRPGTRFLPADAPAKEAR